MLIDFAKNVGSRKAESWFQRLDSRRGASSSVQTTLVATLKLRSRDTEGRPLVTYDWTSARARCAEAYTSKLEILIGEDAVVCQISK